MSKRDRDLHTIQNIIQEAIHSLLSKDGYLFINDINERSITHKLGEYLQALISQYNIDCEYNRKVNALGASVPKTIDVEKLWEAMEKVSENCKSDIPYIKLPSSESVKLPDGEPIEDAKGRISYFLDKTREKKRILTIYPDIICHTRGTMRNRFVIEAKKSTNNDKRAKDFDIIKLVAMITQLGYKYAFYVDFPCGSEFPLLKNFKVSFEKLDESIELYEIKIK